MKRPRIFIKSGQERVIECEKDSFKVDDGIGVISHVDLSRRDSNVHVTVERSTEGERYPHDCLTPQHSETIVANCRIRATDFSA